MSKVKSRDQKPKSQPERGTHVSLETEYSEPANPTLPFQEWTDEFINSEKWDAGTAEPFKDPQPVQLPHGFKYTTWKRAQDAFPYAEILVFKNLEGFPDLRSESNEILYSEFVRHFISSMETLIYLGNCSKLSVEYQSPSFATATEKKPWRPWFHIYSKCKAGKSSEHNPTVNKIGKYVVRLYWMGTWRRVIVDDFIPMFGDKVMLPSLPIPSEAVQVQFKDTAERSTSIHFVSNSKGVPKVLPSTPKSSKSAKSTEEPKAKPKHVVQIWPFILSKALMKIASLTWTREHEILDFDIVQCLTGYLSHKIYTSKFDFNELWKICWDHSEHYDYIETTKSEKGKKSPTDSKKKEAKMKDQPVPVKEKSEVKKLECYMFASFLDKASKQSHLFLIDMTRDKPLIKPSRIEDFPLWKRYRWIEWAADKGLIDPLEPHYPVRCLKVVDTFKEKYLAPPSTPEKAVEEIAITAETVSPSEDDAKSRADSHKSAKSSSSKGKSKKKDAQFPDPTFWIDLEQVFDNLNYLIIYFKPSTAAVRIRVSDITANHIRKDLRFHYFNNISECLGFAWKEIIQPKVINCHRNEPVYILCESTSDIEIVMHLSQTGYVDGMPGEVLLTEWTAPIKESSSECGPCLDTLLARVKAYKERHKSKDEKTAQPEEHVENVADHYRPFCSVVMGEMKWYVENQDNYSKYITTYGSRSTVLYRKPGRYLFRLWILTESPYVLQILSNNAVIAGSWQEIILLMSEEAMVFLENCEEYVTRFDNLLRSFGKPEFSNQLLALRTFYKPDAPLEKNECDTIHNQFFLELYDLALSRVTIQNADYLKILFLAWAFPSRSRDTEESLQFCYNLFEEEKELLPIMQRSSQLIQAFFLKIYNRSNYKKLYPNSKQHKKVLDGLKQVYHALFSKENMILNATNLYRSVLYSEPMEKVHRKYSFYEDLWNVVTLHWFPDIFRPAEKEWSLICRQTFFIRNRSLDVRINLFVDIDKYTARIINNDDPKDSKFYSNRIAVNCYTHNINGYTLLCYGWSTVPKVANYKLCFMVRKEPSDNIYFDTIPNQIYVLKANYIPNAYDCIFRYILKKTSDQILLTVRISASYSEVRLKLVLKDDEEKTIAESTGIQNVVIPLALLGSTEQRSSKTSAKKRVTSRRKTMSSTDTEIKSTSLFAVDQTNEYYIEAYVLHDSWPLTENEWKVVRNLRSQMLLRPPELESTDVRMIQNPLWSLEIIYNRTATIQKDTTRDEQIRDMKAEWYEMDPDRYDLSQEFRDKYLEKHVEPNLNITELHFNERYLAPEVFDKAILPPYDITRFMKDTYDEGDMVYNDSGYRGEGSFDEEDVQEYFGIRQQDIFFYGETNGEKTDYEGQGSLPFEKAKTVKMKIVKTPEVLEMDYQRELNCMEHHEQYFVEMQEAMEDHIDKHFERLHNIGQWFQDCKTESVETMQEGYSLRKQYINNILEALSKKNDEGGKNKSKKGKEK
ncbi:unnamed protein product [Acanthoscelides obtectus]|uniref:Globin domain-containing protein n=1 Tax=Acanthoscelides obtectus TaxID=200917 RepID=A0A9P0LI83_ACAOB|nr:unnamed protein product [Acanthoscelides obtectus]CAK1670064.1 Androglobin [Acanthoscelides obtectus]